MTTNLQQLFENSEGQLPEQELFRRKLKQWGIDGYSIYKDALDLTIADVNQEHKFATKNIFATTFNSYVIGLATARYPQWVRVTPDKRVDRVYLEPEPNCHIYLKQLYGKGKPANQPTGQVRKMNSAELFADDDSLVKVLYLGAIMMEDDKFTMSSVRISHVNTKNSKTEWSLDMLEFAQNNTAYGSIPVVGNQDVDKPLVKGKDQQADQAQTGTE